MRKSKIVTVSGGLASGKSAVATNLATSLSWPVISFGDYVRWIAEQKNVPGTNPNLQAVGQDLMQLGADKFCLEVLNHFGWMAEGAAVVDGVRHVEILTALRQIAHPLPVISIFVCVPKNVQEQRIRKGGASLIEFTRIQQHSTEIQIPELEKICDCRLDGNQKTASIVQEALKFLDESAV